MSPALACTDYQTQQQAYRAANPSTPQYPGAGYAPSQSSYSQAPQQRAPQSQASYGSAYGQPAASYQQPASQYQPRSYDTDAASPNSNSSNDSSPEYFPPPPHTSPISLTYSRRPWICFQPGCMTADRKATMFTRKADLERHYQRVHCPSPTLYDCPVPGCNRVGPSGLPRQDKLREHLRERHRLDIPKVGGRGR